MNQERKKRPITSIRAHISVDAKDGYVIAGHVTPANIADTTEFEKLVEETDISRDSFVFEIRDMMPVKRTEAF